MEKRICETAYHKKTKCYHDSLLIKMRQMHPTQNSALSHHLNLPSYLGRAQNLLATTVATLGHNIEDHLAGLLAAFLRANDLDGLILGLVAWHLDLGAGLLAEVVDGASTGTDDKPDIISIINV